MPGIDADFLDAFAWICIACGETERAAVLLDDTWPIARSPNTFTQLIPPTAHRGTSPTRNIGDVIHREHRTRRIRDSELERLGSHLDIGGRPCSNDVPISRPE